MENIDILQPSVLGTIAALWSFSFLPCGSLSYRGRVQTPVNPAIKTLPAGLAGEDVTIPKSPFRIVPRLARLGLYGLCGPSSTANHLASAVWIGLCCGIIPSRHVERVSGMEYCSPIPEAHCNTVHSTQLKRAPTTLGLRFNTDPPSIVNEIL